MDQCNGLGKTNFCILHEKYFLLKIKQKDSLKSDQKKIEASNAPQNLQRYQLSALLWILTLALILHYSVLFNLIQPVSFTPLLHRVLPLTRAGFSGDLLKMGALWFAQHSFEHTLIYTDTGLDKTLVCTYTSLQRQ